MSVRTFEARFETRCPGCDESVYPGDQATWVDSLVVHATCYPHLAPILMTVLTCPGCWVVPAANGVCGCDE